MRLLLCICAAAARFNQADCFLVGEDLDVGGRLTGPDRSVSLRRFLILLNLRVLLLDTVEAAEHCLGSGVALHRFLLNRTVALIYERLLRAIAIVTTAIG